MPHAFRRWIAALAVLSLALAGLVALLGSAATADTNTVGASADAYVRKDQAGAPHGTATTLEVQAAPSSSERWAYFRFPVTVPTGQTVTSASFQVRFTKIPGNSTYSVYQTAETWAESTLTWNNKPAAGAQVASSTQPPNNQGATVTFTLSSLPAAGNNSYLIKTSYPNAVATLASRENSTVAYRPMLTVVTSPVPLPTTTPPTEPPPTTTAPPTTTPPPAGMFGIRVAGNRLVSTVDGTPVQLRGVNRSGTQYACAEGWGIYDGPTNDDSSVAGIQSWRTSSGAQGMNVVRINGNEDCALGINGVPAQYAGANYIGALHDYSARLAAHGFYVVLDLHHSAPGTLLATGQQPMADRDHSPAYWSMMATAFADQPWVIFDLYNEPYPDSNHNTAAAWTCVRDGGTCPGVSFIAAGMQELLNAVRTAGAINPVMVGGPQYAGVVDQWATYAPTDPLGQLVASIHIYWNTPQSPDWSPCYLQSCWDATIAPLAAATPVVIGEVGEHDCNYGLETGTALSPPQQSIFVWAAAHGVGFASWAWFAGSCAGEPALISAYDGTPTQYGLGLRNYLADLP